MSAAIMTEPTRRRRNPPNRRTKADRVQVLLKPHIRMEMTALAEAEGFSSVGLLGRQLIKEALAARGLTEQVMLSKWHAAMSEAALEGTTHPFAH